MTSNDLATRPRRLPGWARRDSSVRNLGGRGMTGLVVFLAVVLACVAAPLLTSKNPTAMDPTAVMRGPSGAHLLGTDEFGRDVFSRLLYSGRKTLLLALSTTVVSALVGGALGLAAGYLRGAVDFAVSRLADLAFALPSLVLAIAMISVLGTGSYQIVVALSVVYVPYFIRVVRGETLTVVAAPYIQASRGLGERGWRIVTLQVLPNISSALAIQMALGFSYALLAEASLSFLGLGTQPPLPSWGRMLTDAIPIASQAPWVGLGTGAAILLTVGSLNLIADGFRDLGSRRRGTK